MRSVALRSTAKQGKSDATTFLPGIQDSPETRPLYGVHLTCRCPRFYEAKKRGRLPMGKTTTSCGAMCYIEDKGRGFVQECAISFQNFPFRAVSFPASSSLRRTSPWQAVSSFSASPFDFAQDFARGKRLALGPVGMAANSGHRGVRLSQVNPVVLLSGTP